MTPFEYLLPYSLEEALSLLDPEDPDIRPVGGGTAVKLMMKAGVLHPTRLVGLQKIGEQHAEVKVNSDGELVIGGLARLADIERHPSVREAWPLLSQALRGVANPRVRAVATMGGNLSHADPHLDMPPVLAALNARVVVTGSKAARIVNAEDLHRLLRDCREARRTDYRSAGTAAARSGRLPEDDHPRGSRLAGLGGRRRVEKEASKCSAPVSLLARQRTARRGCARRRPS